MAFLASARKYRPTRFDEVVGQEHVAMTLKNALKNDKLSHAFLFCGPRGVGKTTNARILGKVLNCLTPTDDFEPCNTCEACQAFAQNASFNVIELDAASNNSVEHIRGLIEQVRFQPQQGKYKVFIIDEVHMLSQQAFNAFLKTLEEPPEYAIFILATTEKHKIIPTILSRCQIYDFKRIQVPRMVEHLQSICVKEGIKADVEALTIIAQKADGALRDSLSIFDRIAGSVENEITYDDVIKNLNILDYDYFFRFTEAMLSEDLPQVMLIFNEISDNGFEPDIFINGLAAHFRNLLVAKDPSTVRLLEQSENLKKRYLTQAELVPASFLLSGLNILNNCDIHYKMARNKRLHVEMALIKMTFVNRALQTESLPTPAAAAPQKKTANPQATISVPIATPAPAPAVAAPAPAPVAVSQPAPVVEQSVAPAPTPAPEPKAEKEENLTFAQENTESESTVASVKEPEPTFQPKKKKLSLDMLDDEIDEEEKQKTEIKAVPVTLESLQEVWMKYATDVAENHVGIAMKNTELKYEEPKIIPTVGSNLAKSTLSQDKDLMEHLRTELNNRELIWEIQVDETKMPKKVEAPIKLTDKDKLKQMYQVNPLIKDAIELFNLIGED